MVAIQYVCCYDGAFPIPVRVTIQKPKTSPVPFPIVGAVSRYGIMMYRYTFGEI